MMSLEEKLACLPEKPGVYLFKDSEGSILYVGKARVLRNRVQSYFQKETSSNPRLQFLISKIRDLEYILCDSETEALLLEYNLIKEHHPPFNVRLRDDKRYPMIKLVVKDPFPYLTIARKKEEDGNRYFGPYVSSHAMRQTLKTLRKIFQIRSCTMKITGHDRVCLYYHLKECSAPCISAISQEAYQKKVEGVAEFLEGKTKPLIQKLTQEMEDAAENLEFERAAILRNQIQALQQVAEKQKVANVGNENEDYAAIASEGGLCVAEIFHVRKGNLVKKEQFVFESVETDLKENLSAFLRKYYREALLVPQTLYLPFELEDMEALQAFLSEQTRTSIHLEAPKRGEKRRMLDLLEKNARHDLDTALLKEERIRGRMAVLENLQKRFKLPRLPFRIEGYDISTLFGKESVGSMVVFHGGKPEKKHYRKFLIECKTTPDDFAMMEEMLTRRFERLTPEEEDESFASTPDLVLIDGGLGQLSVGIKVLEKLGKTHIPLLSLAKKEEELYQPGVSQPFKLSRTDPGLKLLQYVRDEAHRFAVNYHKTLRDKRMKHSTLESIPGVGEKRAQKLLQAFGSLDQIKVADPDEIEKCLHCSRKIAEAILHFAEGFTTSVS
jgi:excinuclease ABC subunit C